LVDEFHEDFTDYLEKKIFKFKYRQNNDDVDTYYRRQDRMIRRFFKRAETRDPAIH